MKIPRFARAVVGCLFAACAGATFAVPAHGQTDPQGVSAQAIAIPKGQGSMEGMGESFSNQLSSGTLNYSVPISLPRARGAAQPSLALGYSSAAGSGRAGMGWDLSAPFIARQTDRGVPRYRDPAAGHYSLEQDRFVYNGGQELVPICVVTSGSCPNAPGEAFPAWASGWQYFRTRVEGAFVRFFWSSDHQTWRAQLKSGESIEYGRPLDGTGYTGALEVDPSNAERIFKWHIVRHYDNEGGVVPPASDAAPKPVNAVVYRYFSDGNVVYLSDIYDTPPVVNAATADLGSYAHHVRIEYEPRTDPARSYRRGWRIDESLRVTRIDVASKATGASGDRELLRRYHLAYDANLHASLLTSVQVEGRCMPNVVESGGALPSGTSCPRLPPMTFAYSTGPEGASASTVAGFGTFETQVRRLAGSPPVDLALGTTEFIDMDGDGLVDVLQTAGQVRPHSVYVNGSGGAAETFGAAEEARAVSGSPVNIAALALARTNVVPFDVDSNAKLELLFVSSSSTNSYVFEPERTSGGLWQWNYRVATTPHYEHGLLDITAQRRNIRTMDVNADGLVDIVMSGVTKMMTYFNLGRYPGGDGRFGVGEWTSSTTAQLSDTAVETCLPSRGIAGSNVSFADASYVTADMNGDGVVDLARVGPNHVTYWPGAGDGTWGLVSGRNCSNVVTMADGPAQVSNTASSLMRLADVNGDGLDDLVHVWARAAEVFFNVDGVSFLMPPLRIAPVDIATATVAGSVRLVDINGSGSTDIVWGKNKDYRFLDLTGGTRPRLLTSVANGLGRVTEIEYATSTELMLEARRAGAEWSSKSPVVTQVVRRIADTNQVGSAQNSPIRRVTEYSYRDPVFEGRQREFRGFREVTARVVGDANSPSSSTRTVLLTGDCVDETPGDGLADCEPTGRWRDNGREALKGLPVLTEVYDDNGVYLSTEHHTYTLRHLYAGLDGRSVRHAFASANDVWRYDTGAHGLAAGGSAPAGLSDVVLDGVGGAAAATNVALQSTTGRAHIQSTATVDRFGNRLSSTARGCVDGCSQVDESMTSYSAPALVPGDSSGWLWRTVSEWTEGSIDTTQRGRVTDTHDERGRLVSSVGTLTGTVGLQPATGGAPAPSSGVGDGDVVLGRFRYDSFGQLIAKFGPENGCRSVGYDPEYGELAVRETSYVGTAVSQQVAGASEVCGQRPLTTTAAYDRGLQALTSAVGPNGEVTSVNYDGFGRLLSHTMPSTTSNPLPSVIMEYRLADETGSPWSVIVSHTQDGPHETSAAYHDSYTYVDGRGETLAVLSEADPDPQVGDGHNWIVGEVVDRDAKGAVVRKYLATVYDGDPLSYDAASRPQVDFAEVWYDAFGRDVKTTTLDGSVATQTRYHAVGADVWDAEDVGPGDHQGTYASVTKDGHGRVIRSTERAKEGSAIELRHVDTEYLSTGEPKTIARRRGNESIVRTMQYDSFGRMTVNNDPNTSANGKSWRYLYDAAGRLVATSDARGCGVNYRYDAGGRLISEDYSPCESHHAPYNAAPEVTYLYDVPGEEAFIGRPQAYTLGRMTEVTGLGAKSVFRYDARGRKIEVAKQVAAPQGGFAADQWFRKSALYDAADRAVNETTGAVVNVESSQVSSVVTSYTRRGTTRRVDSAYGLLVDHVRRAADGLVTEIQYGDAANTTTAFSHDRLRRLQNLMTYRAHAPTWAGAGVDAKSTQQLLLQDEDYTYDRVGNPIEIRDLRTPEEWPEGAKPAHRQMQYDDLYRLSRVGYEYPSGTDTWKDPYAAEVSDNTREQPSQRADFAGGNRPLRQTFAYDWLGNLVSSGDDTDTFYDRSLGEMTHGASKPYQLKHAANAAGSARSGHLDATYDAAGNMKSLVVHRAGKCIPTVGDGKCRDQRFEYEWDEIGRLVRARRFDAPNGLSLPPPSTATPAAQLDYAYDASGDRVRKTVVDTATQGERHTIYLFSSLELRLARYSSEGYEVNEQTEVPYLTLQGVRLARVVHASEPGTLTASTRVFLELGDHLGTTSVVLDRATGELVERSTAYAYGAPESDYRPGRWGEFRENYRFTGKEDDVEVGLIYFGKRYYAPLLQRWISADPLAVHSPGAADLNLYAYVHGRVLVAVDPVGLAGVGDEPKMEAVIQQNLFPNSTAARADPVPSPQGPNVVTEAQSANEMWRIARSLPTPSALACPHNEGVRLSAAGEADPSYRNHMYLRNQLVLPSMKALELNLTALALVQGAAAGPLAAGALGIGEAGSVAAAPRLALSAAGLRPEGAPLRLTEPSIGKAAAAAPAARTLTDPGLAQFVRRLEAAGIRATGANISMVGEGGRVLGEIDVVTQNALIQFKNGPSSARAVIDQVTLRTEPFVSRPVITFINDAGRAGTRTVNGAGGRILITNDFATLVDVLR